MSSRLNCDTLTNDGSKGHIKLDTDDAVVVSSMQNRSGSEVLSGTKRELEHRDSTGSSAGSNKRSGKLARK